MTRASDVWGRWLFADSSSWKAWGSALKANFQTPSYHSLNFALPQFPSWKINNLIKNYVPLMSLDPHTQPASKIYKNFNSYRCYRLQPRQSWDIVQSYCIQICICGMNAWMTGDKKSHGSTALCVSVCVCACAWTFIPYRSNVLKPIETRRTWNGLL